MKYTSVAEFIANHPQLNEAMHIVCVSPQGEIHEYWMMIESWHEEIKRIMTDYVFINEWHVYAHGVKHFQ